MTNKADIFFQSQLRKDLPEFRVGDRVKVWQKIKEGDKERTTPFEGLVIAKNHGKEIGATFTVREVLQEVGVEKVFPLHSPTLEKIEILGSHRVRRAKLYYTRKKGFGKIERKKKK